MTFMMSKTDKIIYQQEINADIYSTKFCIAFFYYAIRESAKKDNPSIIYCLSLKLKFERKLVWFQSCFFYWSPTIFQLLLNGIDTWYVKR